LASISKLLFKKWRRYFFVTERIDNHCMYSERRREVKYIYSPSFIQAEIKEYVRKSQINKCITEEYRWLSYDTWKEDEYIHWCQSYNTLKSKRL
jgi:nitrate reductase cytochrome c-type subunit